MTDLWAADGTLQHVGRPNWLTNVDLQNLMKSFEDAGFQIYAVGGCVRDSILCSEYVKDVDLSTDARPEQSVAIIESLNWKSVPTGIEHGTITAVAPFATFEITTFRNDVETDGRHATVAFSDDIQDDAMRRDFTMNAFYADRHGTVRDIVGGSADLKSRRIRFIGDPHKRIKEDYLRILRFFRFTASHGNPDDGIDADGLAACSELADGLDAISAERIGMEITRLIANPDVAPIIGTMEQSGVLNRILPGASVLTLARLIDLDPSGDIDVPTRLAALGCDDIAERLRLSKVDAKKIQLVRVEAGTTTPPHELGYRHGYQAAVQCLLLRWASLLMPFDEGVVSDIKAGSTAEFPITAADLMPTFSGKALGDRLKYLEAAWITSRFTLNKAALLDLK